MTVEEERLVERFVRNAWTLSESERARVEALLGSDPEAGILLAFFHRYYGQFDEAGQPATEQSEALLDRLFGPRRVTRLNPYQPPASERLPGGKATGDPRMRTSAELKSADGRTVVLLLYDAETRRSHLHLVTEAPEKRSYALISFPQYQVQFVTDQYGHADVAIEPGDWQQTEALLRLPLLSIDVTKAMLQEGTFTAGIPEDGHLRLSLQQDLFYISAEEVQDPELALAVVDTGEGAMFIPFEQSCSGIGTASLPDRFTIRLY